MTISYEIAQALAAEFPRTRVEENPKRNTLRPFAASDHVCTIRLYGELVLFEGWYRSSPLVSHCIIGKRLSLSDRKLVASIRDFYGRCVSVNDDPSLLRGCCLRSADRKFVVSEVRGRDKLVLKQVLLRDQQTRLPLKVAGRVTVVASKNELWENDWDRYVLSWTYADHFGWQLLRGIA